MPERLSPNPSPKVEIRRNGRITDMILPNGEVRILYGPHHIPTDTSLIPSETDGIFLEGIRHPKKKKNLKRYFNGEEHVDYNGIREYAYKSNIPIMFHDLHEKETLNAANTFTHGANFLKIGSPLIVTTLTAVTIPEAIALTSPLLLDSVGGYIDWATNRSFENVDYIANSHRLVAKAIPYRSLYVLRLRNAVWAAKINWALENGLGSHFTTVVGASHVGLEDYLVREAEGKEAKILKATSKVWSFFADIDSYYSIRAFSRNPRNRRNTIKRVYEVPKLKALAQKH